MELQIQPRRAFLDLAKNQVFDRVVADGSETECRKKPFAVGSVFPVRTTLSMRPNPDLACTTRLKSICQRTGPGPSKARLGRALEIILGAKDYNADQAEAYGTINRALDPEEIGRFAEELADRIALWPAESINACKQAVYASIDKPIDYYLYEPEPGVETNPPAVDPHNGILLGGAGTSLTTITARVTLPGLNTSPA